MIIEKLKKMKMKKKMKITIFNDKLIDNNRNRNNYRYSN